MALRQIEAIADGLNRNEIELVVSAALKAKFRDRAAQLRLLKQLATAVADPDDFVRSISLRTSSSPSLAE